MGIHIKVAYWQTVLYSAAIVSAIDLCALDCNRVEITLQNARASVK